MIWVYFWAGITFLFPSQSVCEWTAVINQHPVRCELYAMPVRED